MNNNPNTPNTPRRPSPANTQNNAGRPTGVGNTNTPNPQNRRPAAPQQQTRPGAPKAPQQKPASVDPNTKVINKPSAGKPGKIVLNKDILLATLALLLVFALAITIVVCCIKAIVDAASRNSSNNTTATTVTTGTTQATLPKDPVYLPPVAGAWNEGYTTIARNNSAIYEGDLLVVNYQHEYRFPSSINLKEMYGQSGHNSVYVLGTGMTYSNGVSKSVELSKHIIDDLTTMLADLKAANADTLTADRRLMVLSGYRTYEKQQDLYSKETVEGLTAKPGFSEHHTGLALDIRIQQKVGVDSEGKNKYEIKYLNEEEQAWIVANAAKYGFILRYTDENKDITGILNEDWHFRYVGKAHAAYMTEHDLCLEEYIDFLRKNHAYGQQDPLNYAAGDKEYIIYYFPASVEKSVTNIYVPSSGYEVSGNNIDGFIVTVTK